MTAVEVDAPLAAYAVVVEWQGRDVGETPYADVERLRNLAGDLVRDLVDARLLGQSVRTELVEEDGRASTFRLVVRGAWRDAAGAARAGRVLHTIGRHTIGRRISVSRSGIERISAALTDGTLLDARDQV